MKEHLDAFYTVSEEQRLLLLDPTVSAKLIHVPGSSSGCKAGAHEANQHLEASF